MLVERIKAVIARIKTDISGKVSKAGDTLTGKLITKTSNTTSASLNIPVGVAPSAPVKGDVYRTSDGIRHINDSGQDVLLCDTGNLNINSSQVANALVGLATGGVGSYVFGTINTDSVVFGNLYSGSALIPSGVYAGYQYSFDQAAVGEHSGLVLGSSYLTGTWRAQGTVNFYSGNIYSRATIFLRVL